MIIELGQISELFRYPVKSMAGTRVESTVLGWHGLDGDRRFAFRRLTDNSGFPWLTASRFPELLLYKPFGIDTSAEEPSPTHVQTPQGASLEIRGEELRTDVSHRSGHEVELMNLKHGIFDEASLSIIALETILGIEASLERKLDRRRFRPNIILEALETEPFGEDRWIGGTLIFGDDDSGAAVSITLRDQRCVMINLDPDTAKQDPSIMKRVVRLNQNNAGVYGTVVRTGAITVGQRVRLALDRTADMACSSEL